MPLYTVYAYWNISKGSILDPIDTIITLGVQKLKEAEKLTESYLENLYDINVLNIDNHSSNENFGQANLIESNTSSLSALVFELIRSNSRSTPSILNLIV